MIQAALTDSARDAITAARDHARDHRHPTITPTDLLIAIATTPGAGRDALAQHTSVGDLKRAIGSAAFTLPNNTGNTPMDPATTECLELTVRIAVDRNVHDIDTGLLLEGLLYEQTVTRTLGTLGVTPDELRTTLRARASEQRPDDGDIGVAAADSGVGEVAESITDGLFGLLVGGFDGL